MRRWLALLLLLAPAAHAQGTPSLTPLTPAQSAAQMQAVQDYDHQDWVAALPVFQALAAIGDARSETDLGEMYYRGWGVKQDVEKAYTLQHQAAAQHYGKAEDNLGSMYNDAGDGFSAFHWFWLAANHGDSFGEVDLGWQYYRGTVTPYDPKLAAHWFALAAAQGNMNGEYSLGIIYEKARGVKRDYAYAMQLYRAAAAQGESASMCALGGMYEYGEGVARDYGEAMRWFKAAAREGDDCGYIGVGYLYDLGLGVPQNEPLALRWYLVAAEHGNANGENDIGAMYHRGTGGVPQDYAKAAYWFSLAAEQGNATAEMNLATLYTNGQGVNQNDAVAFMLDKQAAAQNEPHAQEQLGNIYRLGRTAKVDYAEAAKYYGLAAERGLTQSQLALSYLYETGQGVPRDDVAAYKWYLIAQTLRLHPIIYDDERCQEFAALPTLNLADIQAHLTPSQTAQAKADAQAWLAVHQPLHAVQPWRRWVLWGITALLLSALLLSRFMRWTKTG